MSPPIPPKPAVFHPEVPPPGFEKNLVSFWQERNLITPRLQLFHSNGAPGEGSVEASKNWAERRFDSSGNATTCPHLQIDRTHNGVPRGALLLPSNRKGIANFGVADWSLGFESADTGMSLDPSVSAFDDGQLELCAIAAAYYAILHSIPLAFPATQDGAGTASHTEPFHWSNVPGKICPGLKKKAQVRDVIIPRAIVIRDAWLGGDDVTQEQFDQLLAEVTAVKVFAASAVSEAKAARAAAVKVSEDLTTFRSNEVERDKQVTVKLARKPNATELANAELAAAKAYADVLRQAPPV